MNFSWCVYFETVRSVGVVVMLIAGLRKSSLADSHKDVFRHRIHIQSKYSPQHPVHKYPQFMFLPYCQRPSFTPIQNHKKISVSLVRERTTPTERPLLVDEVDATRKIILTNICRNLRMQQMSVLVLYSTYIGWYTRNRMHNPMIKKIILYSNFYVFR
jgi:hypothetical protein